MNYDQAEELIAILDRIATNVERVADHLSSLEETARHVSQCIDLGARDRNTARFIVDRQAETIDAGPSP